MSNSTTYAPAEIGRRLTGELSRWSYSDGAIRRIYKTHSWKATLMAVNAIGHLCELAWHHPDLAVKFDQVEVALSSHDANGITNRDFALATKIEAFLDWRPASEDTPLEGTPSDPRHAYMRHEV